MLNLTYPGVYTRELPSGVKTISGAPTSVACFVGPTLSGIDNRATRVQSFPEFERGFGGLSQTSNLSYSVMHFFANGGGDAFVLRVPAKGAVPASSTVKRDDGAANTAFTVAALSSGLASNNLFVEIDDLDIGAKPFSGAPDKLAFTLTVQDRLTGRVERFGGLTLDSNSARFAPTVVNDAGTGSKLVSLSMGAGSAGKEAPQATGSYYVIGSPPVGGAKFAADVLGKLAVEFRNDDATGAVDAGNAISLDVTVFAKDDAKPATPLEMVTRITQALNAAIRADAGAVAKMQGLALEGGLFEGGTVFRLRIAPVGTTVTPGRRADGKVTLADAGGGGADTKILSALKLTEKLANPSRYQLGAAYQGGEVTAQVPGKDGDITGQPDSNAFKNAVVALGDPDPFFNLLCLPDLVRASSADPATPFHANYDAIYGEAALVCAKKFAFLLIDPPPFVTDLGSAESWKSTKFNFTSPHSAAYFPNLQVDDPLVPGTIRSHPPSGALAGLYARTDGNVGVWQAPAGTDATVAGSYGPSVILSDDQQGILNPIGLNVIRKFPIYGTVSFGSRTIDGSNAQASDWKYIPVRRTANYILRSLSEGLRWAVHKPNGEQLWSQMRINTTAFMQGLFRQGAFKGTSPSEAYFVACDASTTSPDDINQGVVNIVVGFAPLKPAEFVVINLKQLVQSAS